MLKSDSLHAFDGFIFKEISFFLWYPGQTEIENTPIKIWYFTHLFVSLSPKNKNQKLCQSTQTISNG